MGRGQGSADHAAMATRLRRDQPERGAFGVVDEQSIAEDLAVMLAGRQRWPEVQEFIDAGRAKLIRDIYQAGGPARWASAFGLEHSFDTPAQQPRRTRTTAPVRAARRETVAERRARMTREIEIFCHGRDYFPAFSDWKSVERTDLVNFINDTGGVQAWSKRVGLPLRPLQDRSPYGADRALADGRQVMARFGRIPGSRALQAAGYNKLWTFIRREHGGDRLAFAELCR